LGVLAAIVVSHRMVRGDWRRTPAGDRSQRFAKGRNRRWPLQKRALPDVPWVIAAGFAGPSDGNAGMWLASSTHTPPGWAQEGLFFMGAAMPAPDPTIGRLWTNSLLHLRDEVPGVQLP